MAIIKTESIVLKCTNYRETSKIVTFYTRSHGKLRGIAKGVRSSRSRWGGALQSMAYLNLFVYFKENKDLHLISNAEHVDLYKSIFSDYDKMQVGFRLIELVDRTTAEHQQNTEVFELLMNTFKNLEIATKNYINLLFYFEFKLCDLLGFAIEPSMLNFKLNQGEQRSIEYIREGNFNNLLNLNISKPTVSSFDSFFENYFKIHLEHIRNSRSIRVFKTQEAVK